MATAVASTSTATDTNVLTGSSEITITAPSNIAEGDLLVTPIALHQQGDTTPDGIPAETGWTELFELKDNDGTDGYTLAMQWKVADSGDASAADFTFTLAGSSDYELVLATMLRITGNEFTSDSFSGNDADGVNSSTTSPTYSGGVTPGVEDCLLLFVTYNQGGSSLSTNGGHAVANNDPTWTKQDDFTVDDGSNYGRMTSASATFSVATATGDYSCTLGTSSTSIGSLVAIHENINASVTGSTGTMGITGKSGSVTAGASAAGSTGTFTSSGNSGSVSTEDGKLTNKDKSTASSLTNKDKT